MIEYITKSELRNFADKLNVSEQASLRKSAASRSLSGTTFLSHSSKDDDLVVGAIRVLEGHGARVYVDEIDPEMPAYTTEETAELPQRRIRQNKRLVRLTSTNIQDRRWVPWEWGVGDGYKGLTTMELFPAQHNTPEEGRG